ncbi:hypothetical protein AB3N59_14840 [Leptospira sp. WS92.C1]
MKAVELNESDLDEHEKRFGFRLNRKERKAILKFTGYRTALRFVKLRDTNIVTPFRTETEDSDFESA